MDINKLLKSDYLDILFEGRNKNYGSYELRRKYPVRMRNAGIIGVSIILLAVAGPAIADIINKNKKETKPVAMMKEVTLAEPPPVDPKKPPPPPPPAEPPPPVKPTVKFTPPVIKKDEEVKEDEQLVENKDLKDKSAGIETKDGDVNGIDPGIVDNPGTGTGVVEAPPPPPEIFSYVEQMPEAPYNVNEYLAKNINYPQMARDAGVSGRVVLKFVVDENGNIGNIQVVKGIGSGCDEEAKRVVAGMPPWKAGKSNGKAVKVYFTLPIKFTLQ